MHRMYLSLFMLLAVFVAHGSEPAGLLTWTETKNKIEAHWRSTAPGEKLLSIDKKGEPQYSASQRVTNSTHIGSSWYSAWITSYRTIQGSFARQVATVTVERKNNSKARFEVAALYRGVGERWQFDKIAIGPVSELGAPGDAKPPTTTEALAIFGNAWKAQRPDFDVQSMKLLAAPKLGGTPKRRFLRYRLEVNATGTDKAAKKYQGKSVLCRPADYSSTLIWDKQSTQWRPNESMIRDINEDRDCDL